MKTIDYIIALVVGSGIGYLLAHVVIALQEGRIIF